MHVRRDVYINVYDEFFKHSVLAVNIPYIRHVNSSKKSNVLHAKFSSSSTWSEVSRTKIAIL